MCANTSTATRWADLEPGMHICSIHTGDEKQIAAVLGFLHGGFAKQEKCMYIYNETPPRAVYSEFDHLQNYPSDLSERQIEILPYSEAYMPDNGTFNADRVIEQFRRTLHAALAKGYTGMRVVGEMDWLLSSSAPQKEYLEYEIKLNSFFPDKKLCGICRFDANMFSKEFLLDMVMVHPYVVLDGKLYKNRYFYTSPMYSGSDMKRIPVEDYPIVLSTILEDEPLFA